MFLARHSAFTPQDLQKVMGHTIGFDTIFDRLFDMDLTRDSGYPPYNIRKINELQYYIELALAGFSKEDIEKSIKRLLFAFYTNLFSLFINPARFIDELYFIRVLILRYVCLLKTPRVFLRDVAFYIRYFTHRKGYDPSHRQ